MCIRDSRYTQVLDESLKIFIAAIIGIVDVIHVCIDLAVLLGTADEDVYKRQMLIIGGTSLVVYPAAGYEDYFQGDSLVMINRDETPRDSRCSLVFRESVGKVCLLYTSRCV